MILLLVLSFVVFDGLEEKKVRGCLLFDLDYFQLMEREKLSVSCLVLTVVSWRMCSYSHHKKHSHFETKHKKERKKKYRVHQKIRAESFTFQMF